MAILDSVNELAKRFGVETEEQTISEQLDAITQSIDSNYKGSADIEEAVSEFAKNDNPDARLGTKSITENGTYTALDDELDGYSSVTIDVSGGGEAFEVILNTRDGVSFYPDKTFAETVAAMQNQTPVTMKMRFESGGQTADRVASFFYNSSETERINAIYVPVYFTDSAMNGYVWDENGFGPSAFSSSIDIT